MKNGLSTEELIHSLEHEEDALRRISKRDGALGKNASDYEKMYELYLLTMERAQAISADPRAFLTRSNEYNDKMINAHAKLITTARSILADLNKMRNQDRMTNHMLELNTRELVQAAAIAFGIELKKLTDAIDNGANTDEISLELKRLMHQKLPTIFTSAASSSLDAVKSEFGLN